MEAFYLLILSGFLAYGLWCLRALDKHEERQRVQVEATLNYLTKKHGRGL